MKPSLIMSIIFCTFLSNKYQFPICILELISWFCNGPSGHSWLKWDVLLKAIHLQKLQTIMKPTPRKSRKPWFWVHKFPQIERINVNHLWVIDDAQIYTFSFMFEFLNSTQSSTINYWKKKFKLISILNVFKHALQMNSFS